MKQKTRIKNKPKGYWVKKLDIVFSRYLRLTYANDFGMSACYTCSRTLHYKDLQCGHYISRANMNTRWDESNCRPQCMQCNVFKKGNYTEYSYRLLKECGEGELERLNTLKNTIKQWTTVELKEMIRKYKEKADAF